jgi:hypothetical protein
MCLMILFAKRCCRHLLSFRPQSIAGSTIDLDTAFPFLGVGALCLAATRISRAALLFSALPHASQYQKSETASQIHRHV